MSADALPAERFDYRAGPHRCAECGKMVPDYRGSAACCSDACTHRCIDALERSGADPYALPLREGE